MTAGLVLSSPIQARVASLNLCTDELLLQLADPAQIASVSHLSHSPRETVWAARARRHPANDGSLLSVSRHRPRIVLTMGGAGRDGQRLARALGARLVVLPFPQRLDDIVAGLRTVGHAVGRAERAEAAVAELARLRATAPLPRPALYVSGRGDVPGPTSLTSAWLRLAGYAAPMRTPARVTLEDLLLRPPPLLIRSDYRAGQVSANARWLQHPAVRRLRVPTLITEGRRWTCGGPSLIPEVLRLRRLAR